VQVDELNVLHKPFSATDLANRVRSLLDTPPDGEASHP